MYVSDIINGFAALPPEQEVIVEIWDDDIEDVANYYVNAIEYGPSIVLVCDKVKRTPKITEGWHWTPNGYERVYIDPTDKKDSGG